MSNSYSIDDNLWTQFAEVRLRHGNLNDHLDLPSIFELLRPRFGRKAIDLGCGLGQSSFMLAEELGYDVLAVDASSEMLAEARKRYPGPKIEWIESRFEDLHLDKGSVDLILSCLSFHFVEELSELLRRCSDWLVEDGILAFSVRHPVRTSNPLGESKVDGQSHWMLRDYFVVGPREFTWLGVPCVNFHRPLSWYTRELNQCGFQIQSILEPSSSDQTNGFFDESRSIPFFLTIIARKALAVRKSPQPGGA